jgi:hypothetical protein
MSQHWLPTLLFGNAMQMSAFHGDSDAKMRNRERYRTFP